MPGGALELSRKIGVSARESHREGSRNIEKKRGERERERERERDSPSMMDRTKRTSVTYMYREHMGENERNL